MKKTFIMLLALMMLVSLAACVQTPAAPSASVTPKDPSPEFSILPVNDEPDDEQATAPMVEVPVDLEMERNNQEQVDNGHSPWQLDPLQVTQTFVSLQIMPEGVTGDFPVAIDELKIESESESKAVVSVNSDKTGITKVYLERLIRQEPGGIWTVVGYDFDETRTPSINGLRLGDRIERVEELLGKDYTETLTEEPGHFPENVRILEYEKGFTVCIGQDTGKVMQIIATAPDAKTNLGAGVGDTADKVLKAYREKYTEPESIHGGKLYGVFKVENGQAVFFSFSVDGKAVEFGKDIDSNARLDKINITYPYYMDDSF